MSTATGEGLGIGVDEGVEVNVGLTTGFAIATPLSQMSLFPDFMHVNFLPALSEVAPALEQTDPAFSAAEAGSLNKENTKSAEQSVMSTFFMSSDYFAFLDLSATQLTHAMRQEQKNWQKEYSERFMTQNSYRPVQI